MLIGLIIVITSFLVMEIIAWFTHKYIMHGKMWSFHKDHHDRSNTAFFEKNDVFFLIFAIPSWLGLMFGAMNNYDYKFYIGLGILLYGVAYFIVHDVLIHKRFKWFSRSKNWYVKGIVRAHKIHHKQIDKHNNENFGMLFAPFHYFKINS